MSDIPSLNKLPSPALITRNMSDDRIKIKIKRDALLKNCCVFFHRNAINIAIGIIIRKIYTLPLYPCDINGFLEKKIHVSVSQNMKGLRTRNAIPNTDKGKIIFCFVDS